MNKNIRLETMQFLWIIGQLLHTNFVNTQTEEWTAEPLLPVNRSPVPHYKVVVQKQQTHITT